ncbi:MAG TPA: EF-hand domain-containing protein [Alphaproteobacteria bacterium]|nr:EF-hand domain-containing protein [Alphaproteobacteria bacterium]
MKTGYACLAVALTATLAAGCATPQRRAPRDRPETPAQKADDSYGGGAMSAPPAALMLATLDTNNDQKVDRKELEAGADRAFASADTDGNGSVSIAELADWSKRWMGDAYALPGHFQFDEDQNDHISRKEFHDTFRRLFARFDQNKDGVLERSELLTMTLPGFGRRGGQGGRPGGLNGQTRRERPGGDQDGDGD